MSTPSLLGTFVELHRFLGSKMDQHLICLSRTGAFQFDYTGREYNAKFEQKSG